MKNRSDKGLSRNYGPVLRNVVDDGAELVRRDALVWRFVIVGLLSGNTFLQLYQILS